MVDTARYKPTDRDVQVVAITTVDPTNRKATGITRSRTTITINCAYATGDTITTPAVGEQWYCERFEMEWRLYGRIPFNDATLNIEPEEGQVSVGSARGPLELNGTEVRANAPVFRLNDAYFRDTGETLERSIDKINWEPISAQAAGVIQLLGNALAGVPVTAEIAEYLAKLNEEESSTLVALAEWASGLGEQLGGIWDGVCNSPFFSALRDLGDGDSPLDQVVSGFQNFINDLWTSLFCGFTGDLTPQLALTGVQGIADLLAANPFIQGLASLLGENAVGNLLLDAVGGATEFLQQIVNALFCDFGDDLTPQAILTAISGVLQPLIDNPFIQGLATLADTLGTGVGNLFQDAIAGATGLVQAIFGAIFCDFSGDFTPQNMIAKLGEVLTGITTNPFVAGLISFAEGLGHTVGGGIEKAFAGANELLEAIFGIFFCDNEGVPTPQVLVDSIGGVMDFIRTNPLIVGLVEFIEAVGTTSTGFLQKALEGAFTFFNQVVNTIFCNLPGQPTPTQIMASLAAIIGSVTNNPYVAMLRALATHLGDTSTNLIQQLMAGITGIFDWFIDLLNTFFPLLNWDALKTLDFPDLMASLLGDLNPLAFLTDGKLNLNWLPQIGIDLIEDLSDYLQTNIIGPIVSGITGGLTATLTGLTDFFGDLGGSASTLIGQIVEHFADLILGNSAASLSTFFGNLRALFAGVDFFPTGVFSLADSATAIITNLLNKATGVSLLDDLIPDLGIDKITNLVEYLTGSAVGNVQTFFTNLRNFFTGGLATGGINFLSGSFNPVTALNTFITTVLSQATATISDALIPLLDVSKIENLVKALTGQTITGTLSEGMEAVQSFFSGFSGFNPVTGANNLVNQLVEKITGSTGVLADLSDFFDGFIGSGSLLDQIVNAMTGVGTFASGPLATLRSLFAGVTTAGGTIIDQVVDSLGDFASSLDIAAMVSKITGISIGGLNADPLIDLDAFFDGFAAFTGTSTNLLNQVLTQAGSNIAALVSKITGIAEASLSDPLGTIDNFFDGLDVFGGATTSGNTLVNQIVKRILGGDGSLKTLNDLGTFFTNLRGIFGFGGVNGALNFSVSTAITNLIGGINSSVTQIAKTAIAALDINQISNLVKYITGSDTNTPATVQTFFAGLTGNPVAATATSLVSQFSKAITGKVSGIGSLSEIASFLGIGSGNLLAFDGTNSLISQIVTKVTGDSAFKTLDNLGTFFNNIRDFFGNTINFKTGFAAADAVNKFITDVLNTASTGRISQAVLGVIDIGKINNLIFTLTGKADGIATDLGTFFTNLRNMFGGTASLIPAGAFNPVTVANTFITNILSSASNTLTSLIPAHALANLPISKLPELLTALTGSASTGATLVTEFTNFVTNLRKFLGIGTGTGLVSFLVSTGSFSVPTAINNFITNIISQATATFSPARITGLIAGLTGSGTAVDADIAKFFTNLRTTLGVSTAQLLPAGGTFDATAQGVARRAMHDTVKAINDGLADSLKWAKQDVVNLKATFDSVGQALLGGTATYADLTAVKNFFAPLNGQTGGDLLAKVLKYLTDQILGAGNTAITTLTNFFSGFNTTGSSVTGSLANQLAVKIGGSGATNLASLENFFGNIRKFLGLDALTTAGISLFGGTLTDTNLLTFVNTFIDNILTRTGSNLIKVLTGQTITDTIGTGLSTLQTFFNNLRSLFGSVNFLLPSGSGAGGFNVASNLQSIANNFINNVLSVATSGTIPAAVMSSLGVDKITGLVAALTGQSTTNSADAITKFFSGFTTGADAFNPATGANSLINQLSKSITGKTSGATLTDITNFLGIGTGNLAAFTGTNSLIFQIAQKVGGVNATSLDALGNFFTNVRKFFGLDLAGAPNFFATTGFSLANAVEHFITNVLKSTGVTTTLVTLASGVNQIAENLIPSLDIGKITAGANSLVKALTGSSSSGATAQTELDRFFTNFRALFGGTNWLLQAAGTGGTAFNVANVANAFITNTLSQATTAITSLIPAHAFANFDVSKVTDLMKAVTGQTLGYTPTGDLAAIQRFFSGLGTGADLFNPTTGANNLVNQITKAVTGSSGAIADLTAFFGGLTTGAGTFLQQVIGAVTGGTGAARSLTNLTTFFTNIRSLLGTGQGGAVFDFTAAGFNLNTVAQNFITYVLNPQNLLTTVSGLASTLGGTTFADITTFFSNLRNFFAGTTSGLNFLTGYNAATAANTFITGVLNQATTTAKINAANIANLGIDQITNLVSTLTGGATLTEFSNFFTNLRKFLNVGTTGTDVINFLVAPGSFSVALAIDGFIKNILNRASAGLIQPAKILGALGGATTLATDLAARPLLTSLRDWLTTTTTDANAENIQKFFTNLRAVTGLGATTLTGSILSGTTLTSAQDSLFGVITGRNSQLNTLITQTGLRGWLGAADLTELGNFFTNLTKFFKIADFKVNSTTFNANLGVTAGKFINDVLNQATGFLLNPLKVLGVGGTGTLSGDLGLRPLTTALTTWLTEVGTTNDIQRFFSNLRSVTGLGATTLTGSILTGTTLTSAQDSLFNVITGRNSQLNTLITQTGLRTWLGAANLTEINNFFTNLTKFFKIADFKLDPTTGFSIPVVAGKFINDVLNQATGFLLNPAKITGGMAGTTLVNDLTDRLKTVDLTGWLTGTAVTASPDAQKFFYNLRAILGNPTLTGSVLDATAITAAQKTIHDFVRNINGLQADTVKWATQTVLNNGLNTKATIDGIVKAITKGTGNYADLSRIENFFAGFGAYVDGSPATAFLNQLAKYITGKTFTTIADAVEGLRSFFDRLRGNLNSVFNFDEIFSFFDRDPDPDNPLKFTTSLLTDLDEWKKSMVVVPIVSQLLGGLKITREDLGLGPNEEPSLATLGDIAGRLLTDLTDVPAELLKGILPPNLLGVIPVSQISNTTPNLLSQGGFDEAVGLAPEAVADGWSWDTSQASFGHASAAKLTITSAKDRFLYSRQAVPVAKGDRLVVTAEFKTQNLTVSPSGSLPITVALIPFTTSAVDGSTVQLPAVPIGTARGTNAMWSTIGQTTGNYTVTDPTWKSVIVRLGVASTATVVEDAPVVEETPVVAAVWWDDISLKKVGNLDQGNVNLLQEIWNDLIRGLLKVDPGVGAVNLTDTSAQRSEILNRMLEFRSDFNDENTQGNTLRNALLGVTNLSELAPIIEASQEQVIRIPGDKILATTSSDDESANLLEGERVDLAIARLDTAVRELTDEKSVDTNPGRNIAVNFSVLPNSATLPSTGPQTWSVSYLSGSSGFGVIGGKASWNTPSSNRVAKVIYRGTGTRTLAVSGTGTYTLTVGTTTTAAISSTAPATGTNSVQERLTTALGAAGAGTTVSGSSTVGYTITLPQSVLGVIKATPLSGTGFTAIISDPLDKTLTDYQLMKGTLADPPTLSGNTASAFTAMARVSDDGTSYVYAKAYWAGFGNLRGEIGYAVNNTEFPWQTNIPLTWSTELSFRVGVGDDPRTYQVYSGTKKVTEYTEQLVGGVYLSKMGAANRRFGAIVRQSGGNSSGTISSVSVTDSGASTVSASIARMARYNTSAVAFTAPDTFLSNNFFDDEPVKSDIIPDKVTGTFTVSKDGAYMVNARIKLSAGADIVGSVNLQVRANDGPQVGTWVTAQRGIPERPFDAGYAFGIGGPSTGFALCGNWVQYLTAGSAVRLSTQRTGSGSTSILSGGSGGSETYFSIAKL